MLKKLVVTSDRHKHPQQRLVESRSSRTREHNPYFMCRQEVKMSQQCTRESNSQLECETLVWKYRAGYTLVTGIHMLHDIDLCTLFLEFERNQSNHFYS